ncbi:MAG: hypothetical protein P8Y96_07580 [Desulfuromonadales bacterium]
MDIQILTSFFMWCTIINLCVYLVWVVFLVILPDFVYNIQSRFFPISRETFNTVIYSFLGAFKIFFLVFNVTPYVALLIIG